MIHVEDTIEGYVATCTNCSWRKVNLDQIPLRHKCNIANDTFTYVPPNWASLPKKPQAAKQPSKIKPPILPRQAINYTKAQVSHIAAGRPECTDAQVAERFSICSSNKCGLFISKGEGLGQCAHHSCGCSLKKLAVYGERNKLRWADQQCPAINPETDKPYWGKVSTNEVELRNNDGGGESGQPTASYYGLTRFFRFLRALVVH